MSQQEFLIACGLEEEGSEEASLAHTQQRTAHYVATEEKAPRKDARSVHVSDRPRPIYQS